MTAPSATSPLPVAAHVLAVPHSPVHPSCGGGIPSPWKAELSLSVTLSSVPSSVCEALLLSYPFSCTFLTPTLPALSHQALTCARVICLPHLAVTSPPPTLLHGPYLPRGVPPDRCHGVGRASLIFWYQAAETVPGWPHSWGAGRLLGSPGNRTIPLPGTPGGRAEWGWGGVLLATADISRAVSNSGSAGTSLTLIQAVVPRVCILLASRPWIGQ